MIPFHDDNPTSRFPWLTFVLIGINVFAYVHIDRLSSAKRQVLAYRHGFMPARIAQLKNPNMVIAVPVFSDKIEPRWVPFRGWIPVAVQQREILVLRANRREILSSLLTCMFLHGSWMHLIGNMWFLWLFGNNVEDRLGPLLFIVLYLFGGLLGSGCHFLTDIHSRVPVIGASGAVATVLGAYAITWPWARVRTLVFLFIFVTIIDLPALIVLGGWFLIQLLEGTKAGVAQNVAWWAHIGGFLAGVVLMPFFSGAVDAGKSRRPQARPPDDAW